jgi:hypothetical protein
MKTELSPIHVYEFRNLTDYMIGRSYLLSKF